MALSKDPSRRQAQLDNLAAGRRKLAERLAAGEPPAARARRNTEVVNYGSKEKPRATSKRSQSPPASKPRGPRGGAGRKRGSGFIAGFLGL